MAYCPKCGKRYDSPYKFCLVCGTALVDDAAGAGDPNEKPAQNAGAAGASGRQDFSPASPSSAGGQNLNPTSPVGRNAQGYTSGSRETSVRNSGETVNRNPSRGTANQNSSRGTAPRNPYGGNTYQNRGSQKGNPRPGQAGGSYGRHTYRPTGGNPYARSARPEFRNAPGGARGANAYPYGRPRQPLSKKAIGFIIEIIAAVAAVAFFISAYSNTAGAGKVAEKYFIDIVNGDYKEAYSLTNLEDDVYVNAAEFENYWKTEGSDYSDVTSVSAEEQSGNYGSSGYNRSSGGLFGFGGYSSYYDESSDDEDWTTVTITYRRSGYQTDNTVTIDLIKDGSRWEVNASNLLSEDLYVTVKAGASAEIDGIGIPDSLLQESEDTYNTYLIRTLLAGEHELKVTLDGYKDYDQTFMSGSYNNSIDAQNMALSDDMVKDAENKAVEYMQKIYQAAINGDDFTSVADIFTSDVDSREYIQSSYEYMVSYYHQDGEQLNSLVLTNISATGNGYGNEVDISYAYQSSYSYQSWSGESVNDTSDGEDVAYVDMAQENGAWVLTEFPFRNIGF